MRQIKFRGKSLTDKKWVYGFYCRHDYGAHYQDKKLIKEACSVHDIWTANGWVAVEPDSVGQFTGLLDKNGKEIYEGDIVKYYDDIEDALVSSHVIYHKESCSFCVAPTELCGDYIGLTAHWQFEVIGNIHENPSLIK